MDAHRHLATMDALLVDLLLHSGVICMFHYGCPVGGPASAVTLLILLIQWSVKVIVIIVKF